MNFSLVYLLNRFFYRIFDFGRDWFLESFFWIGRHLVNVLESLDQTWALRITLRNIFQPLYQDHSIVGHTLGFLFRSVRIAIAAFVYFLVIVLAAAFYLAWIAVPVVISYRIFS